MTMRNICAPPSRPGILFAIVLLAMLVCSINYGWRGLRAEFSDLRMRSSA
ncbi:MAG: hypothetical protein R3E68_06285 [Burkholderiaceae bacterium]